MEIFGRGEGRRAKEGNATAVFALPPLFCVGELRDEMTHFGHFTPLHFLSGEVISDTERIALCCSLSYAMGSGAAALFSEFWVGLCQNCSNEVAYFNLD